ncbi:MAG: DUF429 domain-containing protein [Rhodocyclaceae bacterium]|nr:DUF429 domain-containing protein [Rhodocyclaceae bacterium]
MAFVIGVDGCRGGWLAVAQSDSPGHLTASIHSSPEAILNAFPKAVTIAVDVPIGLTDAGPRECDCAARRLLGRPRMSSVFPAPTRPTLIAQTRLEASHIGRQIDGRGVGCQAWSIYPYVRAWDELVLRDRSARRRTFEVHPEVCFFAINENVPMQHRKKCAQGLNERRLLLDKHFGVPSIKKALAGLEGRSFGMDDFYDALAALWSAHRIADGKAISLPAQPPCDRYKLPMAIWY